METFDAIRYKINNRYVGFKPTFMFINTKYGVQMLVKLFKYNVELLVNVLEHFNDIKIKIDSLIIIAKNRKSDMFCSCGFNLNRFTDYTKCKVCGMESCCCCHFLNFKMNKGEIICYKCNNRTNKKIRNPSTFQKIFNRTLKEYVGETNDTELLELIKLI